MKGRKRGSWFGTGCWWPLHGADVTHKPKKKLWKIRPQFPKCHAWICTWRFFYARWPHRLRVCPYLFVSSHEKAERLRNQALFRISRFVWWQLYIWSQPIKPCSRSSYVLTTLLEFMLFIFSSRKILSCSGERHFGALAQVRTIHVTPETCANDIY